MLKGKKKIVQAPVIEAPVQSYPAPAPAPTASPATSAPTRAAPQAPQPMRPDYAYGPPQPPQPYWVQPYPQWQQPPQPWGAQTPVNRNRGGGRGRGGNNGARGNAYGPIVCWTCQQEGHMSRECTQQGRTGGQRNTQPPMENPSGPVSPYGGAYY